MQLFENDIINIKNIYSVQKVVTPEHAVLKDTTVQYQSCLPTYELVFFVSSENKVHFNGIDIEDKVNSVRFLPKNKVGGRYIVKPRKAGYCIDIYFDTDSEMPQNAISLQGMDFLEHKFIKLYNIWTERKKGYYINAMGVFYDIIKDINGAEQKYSPNNKIEKFEKVYDYIRENFTNKDFDYDELCRKSGYASSYFRETFLQIYNITPSELVKKMRMEYATELIITRQYKISEIAEMCGYDNVYYFSSVFKKYFGISPSKFDLTL